MRDRARWPTRLLLAIGLLAALASGAEEAIPSHPDQLQFDRVPAPLPSVEGRRVELAGGAVAYLAEDHTLPLLEVAAALRVGSFLDPPVEIGLASFTGAMLRRAGAGPLSAADFDLRADELGAEIESSTGIVRGGASLSVPSWLTDAGLELFFEMISEPRFQEDRVASSRANLLESMRRRNQDPLDILEREWEWLLFGTERYFTAPVTPAGVARMTPDRLDRFHRRFWHPQRLVLAISGDFEREELVARLEDHLSGWSRKAGAAPAAPTWPPRDGSFTSRPGLYHVEADIPQAKVALGHLAPRLAWDDPERFPLIVMGEILGGGGAISRIAGRLRTAEGLVYRASAHLEIGDLRPGQLRIFFDTASTHAARAVDLCLQEIRRLRTRTASAEEVEAAKTGLLSALRLDFDTAEEIAGRFAEDELLGRPHEYWESYRRGIREVTPEDVRRVAARHLRPDELVVLLVGRWAEMAAGAEPGATDLERTTGHRVRRLPPRDPLTLEPLEAKEPRSPTSPPEPGQGPARGQAAGG